MFDDEGLDVSERDRILGARTHAVIAGFARSGTAPEPMRIWLTAAHLFAERPMPQNHACRQRVVTATGVYFSRFHRPHWAFVGAEVRLGTGRVDLVWRTPGGRLVVDEVKVSSSSAIGPDTVAQVGRYQETARAQWADEFAGVRLLPLVSPGLAQWFGADGACVPLAAADEEVR